MVFYRKYRPQAIEELDSKDVRDTLYAVLRHKDIAHAFLFTGPKGLGKTSAARIVAKIVNCERRNQESGIRNHGKDQKIEKPKSKIHHSSFIIHNSSVEPCNKCNQCVSITNGTNIDVLEIDGASNRGIDEIRDLREKVRLSPAASYKKIYIIDEVHMLTTEAFNALLKTLEEPPLHVIFILCTTEPHKLPQTIISRCLHVSFKKAGVEELVRSFKRIVKKENLDIDDETLYLIATLSDGSFRDGAKILEEIVLIANGGRITKDLIDKKYKTTSIAYLVEEMISFLRKPTNTKEAFSLIDKLIKQGVDMKYFIEQLIDDLHSNLLLDVGVIETDKFPLINLTAEEIKPLIELLTKAYLDMKYAVLPQLPLELAIVEWAQVEKNPEQQAEQRGVEIQPSTTTNNLWQELIDRVKSQNHSIAAVLRGCELKEYDGKNFVIETKYKFHKDKLDNLETRTFLEKVCEEIAKNKVRVSVLLKSV
ncbi:MAG: DNA polymerase III subunit gamma/tau [Patescibacteria group bacterium]